MRASWRLCLGISSVAMAVSGNPSPGDDKSTPPPPPQVAPAAEQIAVAVQAAPEDRRAGARVLGYDAAMKVVELKPGTNDLVCLADNPAKERISVSCYHASLEAFMARGRELRALGETDDDTVRFREAGEGKLAMPKEPATLYVLTGAGVDAAGKVVEPYLRYVVYTPYATAESTGLPTAPMAPGAPWIMFPGTAGSHIMIVPPAPEKPAPASDAKPADPKPADPKPHH